MTKRCSALLFLLLLFCSAALAAEPAAEKVRWATMPELIELSKTEEAAYAYLCEYLLDAELFFPVDKPADGAPQDDEKFKIRLSDDAALGNPAMIFTSERALFFAGESFGWPRNAEGAFDHVTVHGRDAFLVLASNGISSVLLNAGDASTVMLGQEEIESLSDGRLPDFKSK